MSKMDVAGMIMEYESDKLSDQDTLKLFGHLVETGRAWSLQGHYGRMASELIKQGYISKEGQINWETLEG